MKNQRLSPIATFERGNKESSGLVCLQEADLRCVCGAKQEARRQETRPTFNCAVLVKVCSSLVLQSSPRNPYCSMGWAPIVVTALLWGVLGVSVLRAPGCWGVVSVCCLKDVH